MKLINKYLVFIKYLFVAGFSFLLDISLFTLFNYGLKNIILSTILARIISSFINYLLNKDKVFKSSEKNALFKYYLLVIVQMLVSATLVDKVYNMVSINPTIIKVPIELFLFLCNYFMQKYYIFKTALIPTFIDKHLKYFFLSFLSTFSIYQYLLLHLNNNYLAYLLIIVIYLIFLMFYKFLYQNIELSKLYKGYVLILSIILVLGYSYEITTTGELFFGSLANFMLSLIKVLGFYFFFKTLVYYFIKFLKHPFKVPNNKLIRAFSKHPFRYSFLFMFIVYGIFLIIYYPGILNLDNAEQIKEVLGIPSRYLDSINPLSNKTLTNFNPIVHTLLLGLPVKLGVALGNFNFGLFLYTLMQLMIVISINSYAISYMLKEKINPLYVFITFLILALFPTTAFYSITAVKDVLYTEFLFLFCLKIYDYLKYKDKYQFKDHFIFFIISLLVILFRNNGIYLVIITLLFLLIYNKKLPVITLIIALIVFNLCFEHLLLPLWGISGTSIREALAVPFQQTARLITYKKEVVTDEDLKIIGRILDVDNMAKDYDKDLADPVKDKFNKDYTKEDLINYFKVWGKYLMKEPLIYEDATINNVSGFFDPFEYDWKVYHKLYQSLPKAGVDYHYISAFKGARNFLFNYETVFEFTPLGLLVNIAIITWLSILCFLLLLKEKPYYILLIPSMISILFCIVGPRDLYFRYIYPVFMLLIVLFPIIKDIKEE